MQKAPEGTITQSNLKRNAYFISFVSFLEKDEIRSGVKKTLKKYIDTRNRLRSIRYELYVSNNKDKMRYFSTRTSATVKFVSLLMYLLT